MTTTHEIQQELTQLSENLTQIEKTLEGKTQFDEALDKELETLSEQYAALKKKQSLSS